MKKTILRYDLEDCNYEMEPRHLTLDTQKLNINTLQDLQEYLELQKIEYVENAVFESDLDERIKEAISDAQEANLSYATTMDEEDLEIYNKWHKDYLKNINCVVMF